MPSQPVWLSEGEKKKKKKNKNRRKERESKKQRRKDRKKKRQEETKLLEYDLDTYIFFNGDHSKVSKKTSCRSHQSFCFFVYNSFKISLSVYYDKLLLHIMAEKKLLNDLLA